ncbi:homocysteine S-methyltransferase [Allokutzneria sp. A3M-2-11 16]|uniref:homocysteine S-methyltransferase n=1 Tax=Allokutzneria sp. A3M-2-11 16 TaxID=2962043 RepID=UPI0020B6FE67|nr:homocysteine S-methyltransferase [Allokutzneria sp. A3M-2-11 16]MCP3802224.1 homocysteine S-methyltransferase [Allokutzneria sp. A3M-2-11 16]
MDSLIEALKRRPVVLDGGLSNELAAAGHDLSDALWSARLLHDDPSAITAAHLAYFRAGAEVVITASYQATFEGFAARGHSKGEAVALLKRSVALAREAASEVDGRRWVAASVGPYGAMLADGSEYRGRYGLSVDELERFHRPRMETLAEEHPDVFALETIPDIDEAEALLRIADDIGIPAWLSYSVKGTSTNAGQPLEHAFAVDSGTVIATGVNCCEPGDVAAAVGIATQVSGKPVVAYPNGGGEWDGATNVWRGDPTFDVSWIEAGARLIGGCCRVGPAEIAKLAAAVA